MNWSLLIIIGLVALSLVAFLVIRNRKDEKQFEDQLKNDYHKSKDDEDDIDFDEVMK